MKAYRGSRGIAPLILISVLDGCEWSTSRLCRFTPGKEPGYPFNGRLFGSQSRSGRFGKEKNLLLLSGLNQNAIDLYSRGTGFLSRPWYRVPWGFHGFRQCLQANACMVLWLRRGNLQTLTNSVLAKLCILDASGFCLY
jgi:hypothetical protein